MEGQSAQAYIDGSDLASSRTGSTASWPGFNCARPASRAARVDFRLAPRTRCTSCTAASYAVGHRALTLEGRRRGGSAGARADRRAEPPLAAEHWGMLAMSPSGGGPRDGPGPRRADSAGRASRCTAPRGRGDGHDGIPVTTVPWTLLDLAAVPAVGSSSGRSRAPSGARLLDFGALEPLLARAPGQACERCATALAAYDDAPTESELERAVPRALRRARHPAVRTCNQWLLGRFRVDFLWPARAADRRDRRPEVARHAAQRASATTNVTPSCGSPATRRSAFTWRPGHRDAEQDRRGWSASSSPSARP